MYKPSFNSVLVEIDDKDGEWGGGNDDTMLGKSFRKGTVVDIGGYIATHNYPLDREEIDNVGQDLVTFIGKDIMWNEGDEAGLTFEENGKLYGFIYWWSIRGVKDAG